MKQAIHFYCIIPVRRCLLSLSFCSKQVTMNKLFLRHPHTECSKLYSCFDRVTLSNLATSRTFVLCHFKVEFSRMQDSPTYLWMQTCRVKIMVYHSNQDFWSNASLPLGHRSLRRAASRLGAGLIP